MNGAWLDVYIVDEDPSPPTASRRPFGAAGESLSCPGYTTKV